MPNRDPNKTYTFKQKLYGPGQPKGQSVADLDKLDPLKGRRAMLRELEIKEQQKATKAKKAVEESSEEASGRIDLTGTMAGNPVPTGEQDEEGNVTSMNDLEDDEELDEEESDESEDDEDEEDTDEDDEEEERPTPRKSAAKKAPAKKSAAKRGRR